MSALGFDVAASGFEVGSFTTSTATAPSSSGIPPRRSDGRTSFRVGAPGSDPARALLGVVEISVLSAPSASHLLVFRRCSMLRALVTNRSSCS